MTDLSMQKKAVRLRVYIGEGDRWRGRPLDMALLEVLRKQGAAGATVFRGSAGFGAHSLIHTTQIEVLSSDLPVVIETIDTPEKIRVLLEALYPMIREGLITTEEVQIIKYTHRYLNPLPADRLVSEVMTKDVHTLEAEMPVHTAWETMLTEKVKAMPVTTPDGKVAGILTDEDLLERAGIRQRLSVAVRMDVDEIQQELQTLKHSKLRVKEVMSRPVVTVQENDTLGTATACMVKSGLKRLPVVDHEGRLSGIISRLDILRQVAQTPYAVPEAHLPAGAARSVADIMSTHIPMVNQDDDLGTIIEKFSKTESHRLIVVDAEGKAAGLISDSDVVARVQPEKRHGILEALRSIGLGQRNWQTASKSKETAFDLMSSGVLSVPPETAVTDALRMMMSSARKWMVVADDHNRPLGLVDRQRMLEAIAEFEDTHSTRGSSTI